MLGGEYAYGNGVWRIARGRRGALRSIGASVALTTVAVACAVRPLWWRPSAANLARAEVVIVVPTSTPEAPETLSAYPTPTPPACTVGCAALRSLSSSRRLAPAVCQLRISLPRW